MYLLFFNCFEYYINTVLPVLYFRVFVLLHEADNDGTILGTLHSIILTPCKVGKALLIL